jgi:hypothetical protein
VPSYGGVTPQESRNAVLIVMILYMTGILLNQTCPSKREYTNFGKFDDFRDRKEFQSIRCPVDLKVGDWKQDIVGWGSSHADHSVVRYYYSLIY